MQLQFHPNQLPWFLAALVTANLSALAWRRRAMAGGTPLAILLLALMVWSLCDGFGLMAVQLSGRILLSQLSYLGIVVIPPAWMAFSLQYMGYERYLTRSLCLRMLIIPALTLVLVFTNGWHGLVWSEVYLVKGTPFDVAYFGRGPWFWVNTAYTYAMVAAGLGLCGRVIATGAPLYRRQAWVILVSMVVPLAGNVLYMLRSGPFNGVDLTALLFAASGILLTVGFGRFHLLDIVPVARDMVLQSLDSAIVVLDVQGRVVDMNPAAEQVFGLSLARAVGRLTQDAVAVSRVGGQNREVLARFRQVQDASTELALRDGDEYRWYDVRITPLCDPRGRRLGRTAIFADITERKRTEQALTESERRYRTLFQADQDAIILQRPDGTILDCNPAATALFRCEGRALVGRNIEQLVAAGEWARVQGILADRVGPITPVEATGRRPDGATFPMEVGARQLTIADDKLSLVWVRDLTVRKRIEAQLHHAQRMEAVGRLAGGVAHEFNNLLTVINGYSHLLLQSTAADDPSHADLERIYQAGMRAADLTRRLLAFSRSRPREMERLDLNEVLSELQGELAELLGPKNRLVMRCAPQPVPVLAGAHDLRQMIVALAGNARDAMPDGGTFMIELERNHIDTPIPLDGVDLLPGDYAVLSVSDEGAGLSADARNHLFEPFFTTKEVGQGSGLSLAMTHGIVQDLGGHVEVSSIAQVGTTFRIYLPLLEEQGINVASA